MVFQKRRCTSGLDMESSCSSPFTSMVLTFAWKVKAAMLALTLS